MSKFADTRCGGIVEPVHGIDRERLRLALPPRFRKHENYMPFLDSVVSWIADIASLSRDVAQATGDDAKQRLSLKTQLSDIEFAAAKMQHALLPLANVSDVFRALDPLYRYLALRASARTALDAERPTVPALPEAAPATLADLLERLDADLQSLRLTCGHAAEKTISVRSTPKELERHLVKGIASRYRDHFGELPTRRGLFADEFVAHIADVLGMDIGHRVVGEVVAEMS